MKRIALIFVLPVYTLVALGIFNLSITAFYKTAFQYRIRNGNLNEVISFNFTDEEFKNIEWTEKGREFRWKGKMYDVSSITKTEAGYNIKYKHDVVESFVVDLINFQKNSLAKSNGDSKKKEDSKNFSSKHYFNPDKQELVSISSFELNYLEVPRLLPSVFYEVESPPPEPLSFS